MPGIEQPELTRTPNYGSSIGLHKDSAGKDSLMQRGDHGVISAVALRLAI